MDNNKKKLIVIAVLGVAIIGVGAFQFMGGEAKPVVKKKDSKTSKTAVTATLGTAGGTEDPASKINEIVSANQLTDDNPGLLAYMGPLSQRDPFAQGDAKLATPADGAQTPVTPEPQSHPKPTWKPPGKPIPPFNPGLQFPEGPLPNLPNVGQGDKTDIRPGTPARAPGEFAMRPIGVILGHRPAVVFVDDAGNQMLVPLGGKAGSDTVVTGITRDKVRLRHQGKVKILDVGGTPNAQ